MKEVYYIEMDNQTSYEFNYNSSPCDRITGCIVGFAIGDALGAPLEFKKSGHVEDFLPAPSKGLIAGQYTDDTQHLIISLDSLIENNGKINLEDQAERLKKWYNSGNARSIGYTTRRAIIRLKKGIPPESSGIEHINSCGSLALSRLIPYSLFSALYYHPQKIDRPKIRSILKITHGHPIVLDMGELINYYIQEMVHGKNAEATTYQIISEDKFLNRRIRRKLEFILNNKDDSLQVMFRKIGNSGFVEEIVYSSLYSVLHGLDFRSSLLNSVNALGDSDSRGAITGALYGMQVGYSLLPKQWKEKIENSNLLVEKSQNLCKLPYQS